MERRLTLQARRDRLAVPGHGGRATKLEHDALRVGAVLARSGSGAAGRLAALSVGQQIVHARSHHLQRVFAHVPAEGTDRCTVSTGPLGNAKESRSATGSAGGHAHEPECSPVVALVERRAKCAVMNAVLVQKVATEVVVPAQHGDDAAYRA